MERSLEERLEQHPFGRFLGKPIVPDGILEEFKRLPEMQRRYPINFGFSELTLSKSREGEGHFVDYESSPKIRERSCYSLDDDGSFEVIKHFSEESNLLYKLIPTKDWPSFSLSSAPMHQITRQSPEGEFEARKALIESFAPKKTAKALDTCFGFGYLSKALLELGYSVTSCEVDINVLALVQLNPVSAPLFEESELFLSNCDIRSLLPTLHPGSFDIICNDPPTPSIARELYGNAYFSSLRSLLIPDGVLLQYCPRPNTKKRGRDFRAELESRLNQVGFDSLSYCDRSQVLILRR